MVDVAEDEDDQSLDLVQVCGGEEFVEWKVFHELVVLVNCGGERQYRTVRSTNDRVIPSYRRHPSNRYQR